MPRTVLILGGSGMLGHKLFQRLRRRLPNVACTVQGKVAGSPLERVDFFREGEVIESVDAMRIDRVEDLLRARRPDVVVNCVGVIKQRRAAHAAIPSITLNSLLPHKLAETCADWGGRLVHFSTDCVFSGKKGAYAETDPSDAEDLYGKSKYLGEVASANAVTLRTSIIGRELSHHASLLDWFLSQNHGRVRGFTKHVYSGTTTIHLADIVLDLIENHPDLSGLYQVTCPAISKYDLLCLVRDAFGLDVEIDPYADGTCDRSMVGARFDAAVGRTPPSWTQLTLELAKDPSPYERWTV